MTKDIEGIGNNSITISTVNSECSIIAKDEIGSCIKEIKCSVDSCIAAHHVPVGLVTMAYPHIDVAAGNDGVVIALLRVAVGIKIGYLWQYCSAYGCVEIDHGKDVAINIRIGNVANISGCCVFHE